MKLIDKNDLLSPKETEDVRKNIRRAMAAMLSPVGNSPGNPFFYSFCTVKPHYIDNLSCKTAMTTGVSFKWHHEFIKTLNPFEIGFVLFHEVSHILYDHVFILNFKKGKDFVYNQNIANIAMDFVINNDFHNEIRNRNTSLEDFRFKSLSLSELKDRWKSKAPSSPDEPFHYLADEVLVGESWVEIYKEIFEYCKENSPEQLVTPFPFLVDGHSWEKDLDPKATPKEVAMDLRRALETARSIGKDTPAYIGAAIGELFTPVLNLNDYMTALQMRLKKEGGRRNNWRSFKRRFLDKGMYLPKKMKASSGFYVSAWDVSASVRDEELKLGLSQFKSLRDWEGMIVPIDVEPFWDKKTPIKNINDLRKVQVVGRGGTFFDDFFEGFWHNIKLPVDCIVVVTDGYVYPPSKELDPGIPAVWVVFSWRGYDQLDLNFGTKVLLTTDYQEEPQHG